MISDTAMARSARNCAKKDDRMSFFMVFACPGNATARRDSFAAAFSALRRPAARDHDVD